MSVTQYREKNATILVKEEVTYNTDPTLTVANDAFYCDSINFEGAAVPFVREGPSPMEPGWQIVEGPEDVKVEIMTEIVPPTIAADTDVPGLMDLLFRSSGWGLASSTAGDPKTQIYTYQPHLETASLAVAVQEHNKADDNGWEHQALGLRGGLEFNMAGRAKWTAKWTAPGASATHTLMSTGRTIPTLGLGKARVSGTSTVLFALDGGTNYAGGRVASASIKFDANPVIQAGIGGQFADLIPNAWTGTLVLVLEDGGFNPWTAMTGTPKLGTLTIHTPTSATFTGDTPAVAGNYDIFRCHCYIMSAPLGGDAGGRVWTIGLRGGYPVDSSDGGGRKPASQAQWTFGTKS